MNGDGNGFSLPLSLSLSVARQRQRKRDFGTEPAAVSTKVRESYTYVSITTKEKGVIGLTQWSENCVGYARLSIIEFCIGSQVGW